MKLKIQRQKEARERQEVYDNLSVEEKLSRINSRPGESKKERNRLIGKGE